MHFKQVILAWQLNAKTSLDPPEIKLKSRWNLGVTSEVKKYKGDYVTIVCKCEILVHISACTTCNSITSIKITDLLVRRPFCLWYHRGVTDRPFLCHPTFFLFMCAYNIHLCVRKANLLYREEPCEARCNFHVVFLNSKYPHEYNFHSAIVWDENEKPGLLLDIN